MADLSNPAIPDRKEFSEVLVKRQFDGIGNGREGKRKVRNSCWLQWEGNPLAGTRMTGEEKFGPLPT